MPAVVARRVVEEIAAADLAALQSRGHGHGTQEPSKGVRHCWHVPQVWHGNTSPRAFGAEKPGFDGTSTEPSVIPPDRLPRDLPVLREGVDDINRRFMVRRSWIVQRPDEEGK
jgi:hypothetical protein